MSDTAVAIGQREHAFSSGIAALLFYVSHHAPPPGDGFVGVGGAVSASPVPRLSAVGNSCVG